MATSCSSGFRFDFKRRRGQGETHSDILTNVHQNHMATLLSTHSTGGAYSMSVHGQDCLPSKQIKWMVRKYKQTLWGWTLSRGGFGSDKSAATNPSIEAACHTRSPADRHRSTAFE